MNLLAILCTLAVEKFVYSLERFRKFQWFTDYSNWIKNQFCEKEYWNATAAVLIMVLTPSLIFSFVFDQLYDVFALFGLAFGILVLLYSIGPRDLYEIAQHYVDAKENGDEQSARQHANEILNAHIPGYTSNEQLGDEPNNEGDLHQEINQRLLVATNDGVLGVFFWFVVLGPFGAVLYRLSNVLYLYTSNNISRNISSNEEEEQSEHSTDVHLAARQLLAILNWIPVQLTALSYAIAGSFVDTLHNWKNYHAEIKLCPDECNTLLIDTGCSALQLKAEEIKELMTIKAILALARRSVIVWVTALAFLTLAGLTG